MNVLNEAKEIMERAGCNKAFAVYEMEINDIAEVRSCNSKGEFIELEKDINNLVPTIERTLVLDLNKPIECPIDSTFCKYLEFSLKEKTITTYDVDKQEYEHIEQKIDSLLKKYNWKMVKSC